SDTPAQQTLARELGEAAAVISLSDPAMIAKTLDSWALSPERLELASGTAWRLARNRYNWDAEQKVFLASVRRVLAGHDRLLKGDHIRESARAAHHSASRSSLS